MSLRELSPRWTVVGVAAALLAVTASGVASAGSGAAKSGSRSSQFQALATAAVAKGTANQMPAANHVLGGFTSQHLPIVIAVGRKDKRLDQVGTALNMSCDSGEQFVLPDGWMHVPLGHTGAVSGTFQIPASSQTNGSTATLQGGTDTFSGKLNGKRATFAGSWELHLTFSTGSGQTDQCDSGRITFKTVL